jgi:hypothetical protein
MRKAPADLNILCASAPTLPPSAGAPLLRLAHPHSTGIWEVGEGAPPPQAKALCPLSHFNDNG